MDQIADPLPTGLVAEGIHDARLVAQRGEHRETLTRLARNPIKGGAKGRDDGR